MCWPSIWRSTPSDELASRHGPLPREVQRLGCSGVNTPRRQTSIVLRCNEAHGTTIAIRQVRYLHNMEEQDHFFEAAPCNLTVVELMQMIRKGQLVSGAEQALTAAEHFYALAA
jgi:hypothetical protein